MTYPVIVRYEDQKTRIELPTLPVVGDRLLYPFGVESEKAVFIVRRRTFEPIEGMLIADDLGKPRRVWVCAVDVAP